jgi:hypothetical protein
VREHVGAQLRVLDRGGGAALQRGILVDPAGHELVVVGTLLDRVAVVLVDRVGQRVVEDVQDPLVLPHAEARRGDERDQRDDDPDAELRQMFDKAQPVVMPDLSQHSRHRSSL